MQREEPSSEDPARRQPSGSQKKRLQKKANLLTPSLRLLASKTTRAKFMLFIKPFVM